MTPSTPTPEKRLSEEEKAKTIIAAMAGDFTPPHIVLTLFDELAAKDRELAEAKAEREGLVYAANWVCAKLEAHLAMYATSRNNPSVLPSVEQLRALRDALSTTLAELSDADGQAQGEEMKGEEKGD